MSSSTLVMPEGAWDTHVHILNNPPAVPVYGRMVPFPHAPAEALDALHAEMGVQYAVIVDGALGGVETLVKQMRQGQGRYRGVALVDETVSDDDLRRMHDAGVRGARFYFVDFFDDAVSPDSYRRAVDRIARFGWHALVFAEPKDLLANEKVIRDTPIPIVIDHLGQIDLVDGLDQPAMALMLDLQTSRDTYIKISCGDRRSAEGPPAYADDRPFARRVIDNDVTRVIWGSDWPHVLYRSPQSPYDPPPRPQDLVRLVLSYCRSQEEADLILRDTPARLYA